MKSNFSYEEPPQTPPAGYDRSTPPPQVKISSALPGQKPWATYGLLGVTVVVFLLQELSKYLFQVDALAAMGMKVNQLILAGEYWRLITPVFLHGGLMHVGFNMYALFIFGPGLERYYGHKRFLALYFLGGFGGNVFSFLFTSAPSLGSSTAIFGLLVAEGIFLYQNKKLFGGVAQRAIMNIVVVAAINLFIGLSPGIDNWGHLGGMLAGGLFAWYAGPVLQLSGVYPTFTISDGRSKREVWKAGLSVFLFFSLLAAASFFLNFM